MRHPSCHSILPLPGELDLLRTIAMFRTPTRRPKASFHRCAALLANHRLLPRLSRARAATMKHHPGRLATNMEASGTALVHPLLTLRKRRDLEQRRQIRTTQLTAQLAVAPPAQPEEEAVPDGEVARIMRT